MFPCRRYIPVGGTNLLPIGQARLVPLSTRLYGKQGTKRVLEYGCLAMGFANVRVSRYGIR